MSAEQPGDSAKRSFWPWGITLFYGSFVVVVITAGVLLSRHRFDLVAQDYYPRQLAYQDRIDAISRTQQLPEQPRVVLRSRGEVVVIMPASLQARVSGGVIECYRPSDAALDFQQGLDPAVVEQVITLPDPRPGLWSLRLSWSMEGEAYYLEQPLILPGGAAS